MWFKEIIFWVHFHFFSNVAWCNQLDSIMQWWRPYGLNVWVKKKIFFVILFILFYFQMLYYLTFKHTVVTFNCSLFISLMSSFSSFCEHITCLLYIVRFGFYYTPVSRRAVLCDWVWRVGGWTVVHTGFCTITLVLYIGSLPNLAARFPCGKGRTLFILGS